MTERKTTAMIERHEPDYNAMLQVAIEEARQGLAEGGIPIGAAIFRADGTLVSSGHNRRVQQNDPSIHGETDAFRRAGRPFDQRRHGSRQDISSQTESSGESHRARPAADRHRLASVARPSR